LPEAQNIADANMQSRNYAIGAIVGIVSAGLIGDFFLRTKYFLQIFNINVVLLGLDVFLFF
jgi:multisubunit Na+/H+ antiporter MnhE subunit